MNSAARSLYKQHIDHLLHRVNTLTGVAYKDDATIMGWDVLNEPRCPGCEDGAQKSAHDSWLREMSDYMGSITNQLVLLGTEGFFGMGTSEMTQNPGAGTACEGEDWRQSSSLPAVDVATMHAYWRQTEGVPTQGWGRMSFAEYASFLSTYMDLHISMAGQMGKPLLMEEFNVAAWRFTESQRAAIFQLVFDKLHASKASGGALCGAMVWNVALSGAAVSDSGYNIYLDQGPTSVAAASGPAAHNSGRRLLSHELDSSPNRQQGYDQELVLDGSKQQGYEQELVQDGSKQQGYEQELVQDGSKQQGYEQELVHDGSRQQGHVRKLLQNGSRGQGAAGAAPKISLATVGLGGRRRLHQQPAEPGFTPLPGFPPMALPAFTPIPFPGLSRTPSSAMPIPGPPSSTGASIGTAAAPTTASNKTSGSPVSIPIMIMPASSSKSPPAPAPTPSATSPKRIPMTPSPTPPASPSPTPSTAPAPAPVSAGSMAYAGAYTSSTGSRRRLQEPQTPDLGGASAVIPPFGAQSTPFGIGLPGLQTGTLSTLLGGATATGSGRDTGSQQGTDAPRGTGGTISAPSGAARLSVLLPTSTLTNPNPAGPATSTRKLGPAPVPITGPIPTSSLGEAPTVMMGPASTSRRSLPG